MSSFEQTTINALKYFDNEGLMKYIIHNLEVASNNFKKAAEMSKDIDDLTQRRTDYFKVGNVFQKMAMKAILELQERKGI